MWTNIHVPIYQYNVSAMIQQHARDTKTSNTSPYDRNFSHVQKPWKWCTGP
jgi:hypothetical protein